MAISTPPKVMLPCWGAANFSNSAAKVDLPVPEGPSSAMRAPSGTSRSSPLNTRGRSGAQENTTSRNTSAWPEGAALGETGSGTGSAASAASNRRRAPAAAAATAAPARGISPKASAAAIARNTAKTPAAMAGCPAIMVQPSAANSATCVSKAPAAPPQAARRAKARCAPDSARSS